MKSANMDTLWRRRKRFILFCVFHRHKIQNQNETDNKHKNRFTFHFSCEYFHFVSLRWTWLKLFISRALWITYPTYLPVHIGTYVRFGMWNVHACCGWKYATTMVIFDGIDPNSFLLLCRQDACINRTYFSCVNLDVFRFGNKNWIFAKSW